MGAAGLAAGVRAGAAAVGGACRHRGAGARDSEDSTCSPPPSLKHTHREVSRALALWQTGTLSMMHRYSDAQNSDADSNDAVKFIGIREQPCTCTYIYTNEQLDSTHF